MFISVDRKFVYCYWESYIRKASKMLLMCYNGNNMLNKDPINMYVIYKLNES